MPVSWQCSTHSAAERAHAALGRQQRLVVRAREAVAALEVLELPTRSQLFLVGFIVGAAARLLARAEVRILLDSLSPPRFRRHRPLPHRRAGDSRPLRVQTTRHRRAGKGRAPVSGRNARESGLRDSAAIARFAAVTSPGDIRCPTANHSQFQMMPVYRRFAVTSQLQCVVVNNPASGTVFQVPNVAIPAERGAAG